MLRVFYNAGPGNAFETFRMWQKGERDLTTSHVSYSGQMIEACARHGAEALIACTNDAGAGLSEGLTHNGISICYRPDPSRGTSGLGFHRSLYTKAQQNMRDALDFGANVVVIPEDTNPAHYAPLHRRGVRVVQAQHTSIWANSQRQSFLQRLRLKSRGRAYASGKTVVLSVSDVVSAQITRLSDGKPPVIREFLPLYYPEHYAGLPVPVTGAGKPLEILFIGRVEVDKGALDIVEIADRLRAGGITFRFQICGVGGALEAMKAAVAARALDASFLFHGWCDRDRLREVMADCAVTIIPTRAELNEGFNQVVVESVLAGRPVVASTVCPAVSYIGEAALPVPADDIARYVETLASLATDPARLATHIAACEKAGRPFLDPAFSFGAAMDEVLSAAKEGRGVIPYRIDPASF